MTATSQLKALAASHRENGLQLGSQVYASVRGEPIVHFADGDAMTGHPLTTSSILRWYEAGMPLLSLLVGRLLERGKIDLDEPVERHFKGWGSGKQSCTVRHLLTHMGGFAGAELGDRDLSAKAALAQISAYRAEYAPGTRAGFHPTSGWRVLSAIVEAIEGRNTEKLIDRHIFKPLGLRGHAFTSLGGNDIDRLGTAISPVHWCGYTVDSTNSEGEPIEVVHHRESIHNTTWHAQRWEPGLSSWGSAAALARIYEGLINPGFKLFSRPTTLELMTSNHRSGIKDRSKHGAAVPWGLGFEVAGSFGGSLGYRAFGHGGLTGRAICDPVDDLVIVYLTNGLTHGANHERRMSEMTDALYEALLPRSAGAWITTSLPAVGVR